MVFVLLMTGTIIGAVGGFIGAALVFFPLKTIEWLLSEENVEAIDEDGIEC